MAARNPVAVVLVTALGLLVPAAAHATDRFASPDETRVAGFDCLSIATACALGKAMEESPNSLTVGTHTLTLLPGTYDPDDIGAGATFPQPDLFVKTGLTVQGQPGQPAPVIRVDVTSNLFRAVRATSGGILRDLVIERTGSTGALALDVRGFTSAPAVPLTVERVSVTAGTDGFAIQATGDFTIKNTLARQVGGTAGLGITVVPTSAATGKLVGVTVQSPGTALDVFGVENAPSTVSIVNSFLRGAVDLSGGTTGTGAITIATVSSALRNTPPFTALTGPVTLTGTPLAVSDPSLDAAGAPLAGSPLIDAGTTDNDAGTVDLAGKTRTSGSAVDIGAFEFQSPATTGGGGTTTPPSGGGTPAASGPAPDVKAPAATSLKPPKTLKRSKLSKGKGVSLSATLDEAVASAKVELIQITKKKGKAPKEKVLGTSTLGASGTSLSFPLKVKSSKLGKGKVKLTLRFTFIDAAGNKTVVDKAVTVN